MHGVLHKHYPWSVDLLIHVPFQLPLGAYSTAAFSSQRTYHTHIAISLLPGTHLHLSGVEQQGWAGEMTPVATNG